MNSNSGNGVAKNLAVKGNLILNQSIKSANTIAVENSLDIRKNLEVQGSVKKMGSTVPESGQVLTWNDTEWVPGNLDQQISKVFTGTTLNTGDTVIHELYSQASHSRSVVELKVLIHDVNSDTFYKYLEGRYMWYRQWDMAAVRIELGDIINLGTGENDFDVDIISEDSTIKVRIIHNTIETNTRYKIIAKIMQT